MVTPIVKRLLIVLLCLVAVWLGIRYVVPLLLPFLLGSLLALASEPAVNVCVNRLRLRRGFAAGIGVTLTLVILVGVVVLLAAVVVKRLGAMIPDLEQGIMELEDWLIVLADGSPEGIRPLAQRTVLEFFDDGTALVRQVSEWLPGAVKSLVSGVGSSALSVGTGILSAFLISVRLPVLRQQLAQCMPESWKQRYLPAMKKLRGSLLGWIKAQGKLALVTWGIVLTGFLVLGIRYAPLWSALVALVDAIPILGTGVVLLPFAAVSLLQGNTLRAVGLLCTYGAAAISRTVLEPRLVGRQLGLDPLATLVALYVGFRLWGIPGLLFTPILASAGKSLLADR